jgi:hypothetical protein
MKYSIRPFIYNTGENMVMFLSEIQQLSLSETQDIIDSCHAVVNDKNKELWWGMACFGLNDAKGNFSAYLQ